MLLSFLALSLPASEAVSLTTKPQGINLPINSSFSDLISNAPNPINPSISSPISIQPFTSSASNRSDLGDGSYECDRSKFGEPAIDSCREAYSLIRSSPGVLKYADRAAPDASAADVLLPIRYSSSDGTCFIELFSTEHSGSDYWTSAQFKRSAHQLLKKCVFEGHGGGSARRLGQRGGLSMVLAQETPHVECSEPESKYSLPFTCINALDKLPASEFQEIFGPPDELFVDVPLPVEFSDPDAACSIEVSLTGPAVLATWYSIWSSAVSIVAMCVRFGKEGISVAGGGGGSEITVRVTH